eukprot:SAG11_NODE_11_length_27870_cov_16.327428_19_plen_160_part_00
MSVTSCCSTLHSETMSVSTSGSVHCFALSASSTAIQPTSMTCRRRALPCSTDAARLPSAISATRKVRVRLCKRQAQHNSEIVTAHCLIEAMLLCTGCGAQAGIRCKQRWRSNQNNQTTTNLQWRSSATSSLGSAASTPGGRGSSPGLGAQTSLAMKLGS